MREWCLTSSETGLKCLQRTPLPWSCMLLSPFWSSRATSCLLTRDFPNNCAPVLLTCHVNYLLKRLYPGQTVQIVSWNWTFNKPKATNPRSRALWSPAAYLDLMRSFTHGSFDAASAPCPVTMALCQWVCFRSFWLSSNGRTGEHPSCRQKFCWVLPQRTSCKWLTVPSTAWISPQMNPPFISELRCYSENNFPQKFSFLFPFISWANTGGFPDDQLSILESLQHPLFAWRG